MAEAIAVLAPAVIPGPVQAYDTGEEVEDPVKVTVGDEQVIAWGNPAFTFGLVVLVITVTVDCAEHPLEGSVAVSV